MLKRLFEDYEVEDEKIENKLVISSKVSYALSKYGEQLRMTISK